MLRNDHRKKIKWRKNNQERKNRVGKWPENERRKREFENDERMKFKKNWKSANIMKER